MERRKRSIGADVAFIAVMTTMIIAPVFYYRWSVMTPRLTIFWIVFGLSVTLATYGLRLLMSRVFGSMHELMAWTYRNNPPSRNYYWRPPRRPGPK